MTRVSVTKMQQNGGVSDVLDTTTGDTAGMEFYNNGQEILFLYGGSGTAGGEDVDIVATNAYDIGEAETLTVKCGSTSADDLTIVGNFKPRNWALAGMGADVNFTPATNTVDAGAIQILSPIDLKTPFALENLTIGAGKKSTSVTGGDPSLVFPNDGRTVIVAVCGSAGGTYTVEGDSLSSDSERLGSDDATAAAIGDLTVFGPRDSGNYGSVLKFTMTSAASTNCEVLAFSLKTGELVSPA